MARKVTVSKFKYFILKLWEFARLFTAMACVNLVFSTQKLNSNGTLQLDTRGFNASFSCWIPKCLNWTDSERLSKRVFVVELKTSGIKDALSVSNTSETDSLMADLTRSSMEWCFSFVNQWSISCNPTREINRWWGETGVIGKEEKIANNEAQHTLCAIVLPDVKSTGTLLLFCSDCSLFFQFSIISIFCSLVGFSNLTFLFCVFRLVEKKCFWTSIFCFRCTPFRYSSRQCTCRMLVQHHRSEQTLRGIDTFL